MATEDLELVARALEGSEAAYREIVRRYERSLFTLILRMVRDRSSAEDLAQDSFVKAFRNLRSFDPTRKFSSWLFKIAHNTAIDHLRRRDPVPLSLDAAGPDETDLLASVPDRRAEPPDRALGRADLAHCLERAVATLRPEYREAIVLRFTQDLSYDEIAEVMGLPLGTVKTHLHRARKELAAVLQAMGWSEGS